ncbi:MAG: hypothetical protein U0736_08310 [Gemmataceae bacterium]
MAEAALAETANPAATFAARAEGLQAQGKAKEAQAVLARGLKAAPEPKRSALPAAGEVRL